MTAPAPAAGPFPARWPPPLPPASPPSPPALPDSPLRKGFPSPLLECSEAWLRGGNGDTAVPPSSQEAETPLNYLLVRLSPSKGPRFQKTSLSVACWASRRVLPISGALERNQSLLLPKGSLPGRPKTAGGRAASLGLVVWGCSSGVLPRVLGEDSGAGAEGGRGALALPVGGRSRVRRLFWGR